MTPTVKTERMDVCVLLFISGSALSLSTGPILRECEVHSVLYLPVSVSVFKTTPQICSQAILLQTIPR